MNSPRISVIVPIYKAEETLVRCLDSLKAQTFTDFEVLMVDDGSPDRCGKMIDDYAGTDCRFRAFHQENGGVSAARQCGMDNARGEYTIHADPDDWVEPTMLEDLYGKAKEDGADMVICDFYENTYKGQRYIRQQPSALDCLTVQKELFQQLHSSCWNKLVSRACYSAHHMRFPSGVSFCEDQYVVASLLMNQMTVAYLPKAYYHYVRNDEESLSRRYSLQIFESDLELRRLFDALFESSPIREFVFATKSRAILSRAFWGGAKAFTSAEFRHLFSSYRVYLAGSQLSKADKVLLYGSCLGFYRTMRMVAGMLLRLKHFVLSLSLMK